MRTLIAACVLGMATSALAQGPSKLETPSRYALTRESDTLNVGLTLIKADNSGRADPSLGGLDSTLRGVLRFTGYRGIAGGASARSFLERRSISRSKARTAYTCESFARSSA